MIMFGFVLLNPAYELRTNEEHWKEGEEDAP